VPGPVERRRDPVDDGLGVRLVHRRLHRVASPDGAGGARTREGGRRGEAASDGGAGGGGRREEGAEQDQLPAEGLGGGPHAPPVRLRLWVVVSPRDRGPAHGTPVRRRGEGKLLENCWRGGRRDIFYIRNLANIQLSQRSHIAGCSRPSDQARGRLGSG
jgi:hypothetical protein